MQNRTAETTSRFTAAWKGGKNSEKARGKRGHTKCGGKKYEKRIEILEILVYDARGMRRKTKGSRKTHLQIVKLREIKTILEIKPRAN